MTINVTKIVSPDLFVENESLVFNRGRALQYASVMPPFSAITFVAQRPDMICGLAELAVACGNEAIELIMKMKQEGLSFWLFVTEKIEAPTTQNARMREYQITRYKKDWNERLHLLVSSSVMGTRGEVVIESGTFIYLAGLLDVCYSRSEAINAVRTHPAYSIIVSKRPNISSPESIRSIFSSSFPREDDIEQMRVNWLSLAVGFCPGGDLLLRVSGLFDDRESAVDIIGTREMILNLWRIEKGTGRTEKGTA